VHVFNLGSLGKQSHFPLLQTADIPLPQEGFPLQVFEVCALAAMAVNDTKNKTKSKIAIAFLILFDV